MTLPAISAIAVYQRRTAKKSVNNCCAAAAGEVPVAAAVIDASGQIIVVAENRMNRDAKSTSHAEMLALEAAMSITGNSRLDGYDLWVSLEPCTRCAGAIAHARISRLYFAATDQKEALLNRAFGFLTR